MVCDFCGDTLCRTCSKLSTSEAHVTRLSKQRILLFACEDCIPVVKNSVKTFTTELDNRLEKLKEDLGKSVEKTVADISRDIKRFCSLAFNDIQDRIKSVESEVSNLKQTNIDMVRLFSNSPKAVPTKASTNYCLGWDSSSSLAVPVSSLPALIPAAVSGEPAVGHEIAAKTYSKHAASTRPLSKSVAAKDLSGTSEPPVEPVRYSSEKTHTSHIIGLSTTPSKICAAVIEKKNSVLVGRLDRGVSASDLKEYLQDTFGRNEEFNIEEQTVRSGDYRSYRVEVSLKNLDKLLTPSLWPENVVVKKFRFFRHRPKSG